jgi:hypothetical protein
VLSTVGALESALQAANAMAAAQAASENSSLPGTVTLCRSCGRKNDRLLNPGTPHRSRTRGRRGVDQRAPNLAPHRPFGGIGISGVGKEGGQAGFEEFLRIKSVAIAIR